jgi:hypothetical protein
MTDLRHAQVDPSRQVAEAREWCEDFKAGQFSPAHTRDGWTVEMHGLVESHLDLADTVDALLAKLAALREAAEEAEAELRYRNDDDVAGWLARALKESK